jgi:hypothetical protein
VTNVKQALVELDVRYAVALDNDFKNWEAYRVWAWPSMYILDKQGRIRFTHIGEGAYEETERVVQQLLREG